MSIFLSKTLKLSRNKRIIPLLILGFIISNVILPINSRADRQRAIIGAPENTIPQNSIQELGISASGLISNKITSLAFSPDGQDLWVGTLRGLSRLNTQTQEITNFTIENGLPANEIYSVLVGPDNRVWVGTDEAIAFFDGENWTQFDDRQGFEKHRTLAITSDLDNNIWLGTNDGLWQYTTEGKWRFYRAGDGNTLFREASISALTVDSEGTLWIGGSELYSFIPSTQISTLGDWQRYEWEGGFSKVITALAVDNEDRIWVGTNRGVLVFDDGFWVNQYDTDDGLASDAVNSILIDSTGNKWFGTDNGVSRLSFDNEWTTYQHEDGGLIDDLVMTITTAPNDQIWMGTLGGVSHFDGITWENFRTSGRSIYDPIALISEQNRLAREQDALLREEFVQNFAAQDLDGHWSQEYFVDLVRSGIISGFEDGTYRPDALITRSEVLKMIIGAAGYPVTKKTFYDIPFTDVAQKSWAAPYVYAALSAGIIENTGEESFRPDEPATRAEASLLIAKAFNVKNTDGSIDFFDVSTDDPSKSAIDALSALGIVSGQESELEITVEEYDLQDRYDFRLARDIGLALAEIGFYDAGKVSDYYNRDLMNAVFNYQKQVVYGQWNWNFGYLDEKTREVLGQNHITKTEMQTKRLFYPNISITRGQIAKIIWNLMEMKE